MSRSKIVEPFERAVRSALRSHLESSQLTEFAEEFGARLEAIYRAAFPKVCGTCGRVFETEDAWEAAAKLSGTSTIWDSSTNLLHDYRDCNCGSTLLVVLEDRRDETAFGSAKRELFVECVERIVSLSGANRAVTEERVRSIFRETAMPIPPRNRERLTARDVQVLIRRARQLHRDGLNGANGPTEQTSINDTETQP